METKLKRATSWTGAKNALQKWPEKWRKLPRKSSVDLRRGQRKGATSKNVKNRQKVSRKIYIRHFSTFFARHQFSGPFWGALKSILANFCPCPAEPSFLFGFSFFPHFRVLAVFHAVPARHDPKSDQCRVQLFALSVCSAEVYSTNQSAVPMGSIGGVQQVYSSVAGQPWGQLGNASGSDPDL